MIRSPLTLFHKKMSNMTAHDMVRTVSNEEIIYVMFAIGDDKASGPDKYTSKFFKASWSIVGDEVSNAVRDFFNNGQLLKEINNTVISLIPKVTVPDKITNFRPISCCNVIYKCISKIISERKMGLAEIISDNQAAYVPQRSIFDNILLTQELMKSYHL